MLAALFVFILTLCAATSRAQSATLSGPPSVTSSITPTRTSSSGAASTSASVTTSFSVSGTTSLPITITLNQASSSVVSDSSALLASSTITAEYPSLSGYPICVTQCIQSGVAQTNCTSIIETSCYCGQQLFANATAYCVAMTCPDELSDAENLAQRFCNVHSSVSLSFPPTPSTTSTRNSALQIGPSKVVVASALIVFVGLIRGSLV
ncbi:hypothetical protein M407DRAFT_240863 [Tulasnella calospora MUT 4182]|uniref:CFEM domain-containing protein n=1 Tax=Tulasnella calospora MUT 4182 TaxID=1051891 RepID=A0A0C3LJ16_9AGAM|nr:hypothetical protein M407DRAFT_240863 [Tulasnella calospora MUT 4182]